MMAEDAKKLYYNLGEFIWRRNDNALFVVARIMNSKNEKVYQLICVNGVGDDTYASCDKIAEDHTIFTPIAPGDLKLNQHIWTKTGGREYTVSSVFPGEPPENPCHHCYNGMCEQCTYGYKSEVQIMSMIGDGSNNTKYRIVSMDGKRSYDVDNNALKDDSEFTVYPSKVKLNSILVIRTGWTLEKFKQVCAEDPTINSDDEAEKIMNERLEAESVDTGETIEDDSYTRWKKGLKVVNLPKYDLNYFQRGLAYHVHKVNNCYPGEFHGIMLEATEGLLKVIKLGNLIHYESTEVVEIPLKEYMNGEWRVVRLIEEEKEND